MRGYRREGFHAFSEYDGFSMFENQKSALDQAIKRQADDYILNVNREEYLQHLISEFCIEPIEIHKDGLSVSTHEEMIPAEMHPRGYFMDRGGSYPRDVLVFHLPFSGDPQLLKVRASTYSMSAPLINVEQGCITFRMINFNLDAQRIKQESDNTIRSIETQNGYLTRNIESFNSSLRQHAERIFDARKEQLLKKNNLIASLGVPIKETGNKSGTFSVPAKRTKAIASKPQPKVTDKGYQPEPTLDSTIYVQILKIIHDVGKQFERLPSTYSGKEEEHLRDHMLLILEPNFEGAATGETFNKSGKTDILLRHEGKNVFIAELKYWHGKKGFLETISQLLGYLTWRDSKAAVVMFVRNKDFMAVLETAKDSISEHENYLGFVNEQEEGWYSYRFHLNGDKNREVNLAVMLFHIPA
ncbi:hypothetical protein TUM4630_32960 [Shewanella algidipiscicola]|uniref:Uncharacterized protein n=2 Tax=Shewanella algidipiscicola TaxID=614070 RepID=A0ABQ4NSL7_9GAMM|nr:hypothetical protein TUM4630_32960 [Shewanella algidipiscicola]